MAKVRVLSDLHVEFGELDVPRAEADVVVLAGDIHIGLDSARWSRALAEKLGIPVVLIAGNHEHYFDKRNPDVHFARTIENLRSAAADSDGRLIFLERETAVVAGTRFLGCTLWTDFVLLGSPSESMAHAQHGMTDYHVIKYHPGVRFTPNDARREFLRARDFLRKELEKPHSGPTVVVTHHSPSMRSVPALLRADALIPAYASRLDALVMRSEAALWVHGHIHASVDYKIGSTRVVCNPRGYADGNQNELFDPSLVIDVGRRPQGDGR